ncbi:MAG: polyphosphate kinase 1 [Bacteroidia bacterium]
MNPFDTVQSGILTTRKLWAGHRIALYNREVSWLEFNERVLLEAENPSVPLGERIQFMAIFSSNMDEFFRVRVANQYRLLHLGKDQLRKLDFHPRRVLAVIHDKAQDLQQRFERLFEEQIIPALEHEGVVIQNEIELPSGFHHQAHTLFMERVQPYLNPIVLDNKTRPLRLRDSYLYLALKIKPKKASNPTVYALLELPVRYAQRFYSLGTLGKKEYVIFIDDLVRMHLNDVFASMNPESIESYTIKMTRDQELDLDQDLGESLVDKMKSGLRKRGKGDPVRFIYDRQIPEDLLRFLVRKWKLKSSSMIEGGRYHNFKDLRQLPLGNRLSLFYPPWVTVSPGAWSQNHTLFKAIREKDRLLHHPYHAYDTVLRFLREAALDPSVRKIEITLYRLATISSVARSLITAALNGKKVVAIVEIQARFDEENNMFWAEKLQEAGAEVHYGLEGYKIHCKMCLVTRRERGQSVSYAHLSTGNYNAQTAKIYADDSLFTANTAITQEVSKLFKSLIKGQLHSAYRNVLVAPYRMREPLLSWIDYEIRQAKKGHPAWILIKLNSLVDEALIAALYRASQAGVEVRCLVRGICGLIPGIPGLSENIRVVSIVDRYLEHSRVYAFCHGSKPLVYLSSADWMARNMDHRVELAFPILDSRLQREVLDLLEIQWKDRVKARWLNGPHANQRVAGTDQGIEGVRAQEAFFDYLRKQNEKP